MTTAQLLSHSQIALSAEAERFGPTFGALGHPARVEVLRLLLQACPDGLVVGEIQRELGMPGSTLSHHLEAMRQGGLVCATREGRFLRYRAHQSAIRELVEFLGTECYTRGYGLRIAESEALLARAPATDQGS